VGVALAGSVSLVKTFDTLALAGLIDQVRRWHRGGPGCGRTFTRAQRRPAQKLARKLIHILAGPGFILTWPLFRCRGPEGEGREAPSTLACS